MFDFIEINSLRSISFYLFLFVELFSKPTDGPRQKLTGDSFANHFSYSCVARQGGSHKDSTSFLTAPRRHDEDAGSINHERAMGNACANRGWQSDYPKLSSGSALMAYAKGETGKNISQTFYEWSCVSIFFREISNAVILFSATSEHCLPRQQVYEYYVVLVLNV